MKQIVSIREDNLCPSCKQGWMVCSAMKKSQVKPGWHNRKYSRKCVKCGYKERKPGLFFGVEIDIQENYNYDPCQPSLFNDSAEN